MTNQVYSSVMKAAAFAAGLAIGLVCYPVFAAPASGGETVQGLYDALLKTMKNARALGQSGRFTQLTPVIRRSFDIALMARHSVGPSWSSLTDAPHQRQLADLRHLSRRRNSEVATRRSEFAAILKSEGIDGLITALNRKADLLTGTTASAS